METVESQSNTRKRGTPFWFWPVVSTGLINAVFMIGFIAIFSGDPSSLIFADRAKIGEWPFEKVKVGFPNQGFDGQYFYVLAQDPWNKQEVFLDLPAYRHSRIVYPLLAWLLTAGDPYLLFWVLPLLNWLALLGLAWLGAVVAHHYGRSAWWGFALPFFLNALAPALRNLTDPIATLLACSVVAAWLLRWRPWIFAPICTLTLLSREQNLVLIGIVMLESLVNRRYRVTFFAAISIPLWILWVVYLRSLYGEWPFVSANSGFPFEGIWYRLQHMTGRRGTSSSWIHAIAMATLFAYMIGSLKMVLSKAERGPCLVAIAGLLLCVQGGTSIYLNLESYIRVFWWMPFGLWIWAIQTGRVWPALYALLGFMWSCYALSQAISIPTIRL